jgi:DNA-binding transcriptional ArsR family regulator
MSRLVHPDLQDVSLSAVLHALADPVRRAILRSLAADKSCDGAGKSCAAAAPPDVPRATLSHHYSILRAAGLVRGERKGVEIIHKIRCDEVDERFPGVLSAILAAKDEQ